MIHIADVVEMLNRLHQLDPTVLPELIEFRVPVSQTVMDDHRVKFVVNENDRLGLLGVLNGLAAMDDKVIKAVYADTDDGREVLREFVLEAK